MTTKIGYTLAGTHPLWDWGQVDVPDEEQRDYLTAKWSAEQIPVLAIARPALLLGRRFSPSARADLCVKEMV